MDAEADSHLVAFFAVAACGEGILAVVTGAAGFPLFHIAHGVLLDAGLEREDLGVAVGTLVHPQMDLVAEADQSRIGLEGHLSRPEPLVALVALADHGEGVLAVMAGTA